MNKLVKQFFENYLFGCDFINEKKNKPKHTNTEMEEEKVLNLGHFYELVYNQILIIY